MSYGLGNLARITWQDEIHIVQRALQQHIAHARHPPARQGVPAAGDA